MVTTARDVAKDFLQSVVVVDDRAVLGGEDAAAFSSAGVASGLRSASEDASSEGVGTSGGRSRRRIVKLRPPVPSVAGLVPEQALDAKVLVNGFAERGLVCAVIRPGPSESPVDLTVSAAERADIVILDWELNGDNGASTLAIVRRLVNESEPQRRLRLIAVYSGALTLRQIAERLRAALAEKRGAAARFKRDGRFAIEAGFVRVTVFGKPTTRLRHADAALRDRIVAGAELPDRLVDEFARMTKGLVPHVALASLTALRKNMHRVLGQLRGELDAAYLWHRATQTCPTDAELHLVDLIAGELRSILDDERVGDKANLDAIAHWIDEGQTDFTAAFGATRALSAKDVLALLSKGSAGRGDTNKDIREKFPKMGVERGKGPHREEGISGFAKNARAAKRSNEHFAALMSLRTRYEHPVPRLALGTILVRGRGSSRTHWLCIQPLCDSVRLTEDTAFPLLPLKAVKDGEKFDLLLPGKKGVYRRFRLSRKPAVIEMPVFSVQPSAGDAVIAERHGKSFVFRARKRRLYFWVAELRPEYAQRIAQQIANEFSRVGFTESEWLRLWATKG